MGEADLRVSLRAFVGQNECATLLRLDGPLRYMCAVPLRDLIDRLTVTLSGVLVIDLRATTFIDSTGLGLITRAGRLALSQSGRRAVIITPQKDILTVLVSAAVDVLFVMVDEPPADVPSSLSEAALTPWTGRGMHGAIGRVVLDAHRDLAGLSARNREEYRDVITALEADLAAAKPGAQPASQESSKPT